MSSPVTDEVTTLQNETPWLGRKAQLLYEHLSRTAGAARRLTSSGKAIAAQAGCAYSLVVKYLGELEEAGWIARVRHKHGATEYLLTRPEHRPEQANASPEQAAFQHAQPDATSPGMSAPTLAPLAPAPPSTPQHPPAHPTPPAGHEDQHLQSSEFKVQSVLHSPECSDLSIKNELSTSQSSDSSINEPEKMNSELLATAQSSDLSIKAPESGLKVQSSEFKVQSSTMHSVQVRTSNSESLHACMHADQNLNFELLADFRKRVNNLLAEFGIGNPKRTALAGHIVALAAKSFSAERAEEILADMRKAQERTAARKDVKSAPAVMVKILEDYAETGQMVLFEAPPDVPVQGSDDAARKRAERERKAAESQQTSGRTFRRPQVAYTDDERAEKQRLAAQRLAGKVQPR
jgi:hypothetical protein